MIISVNPEDEICKHFEHLKQNSNYVVEWATRVINCDELEKQKSFYAYTFIAQVGIKYRFLVVDFKTRKNKDKILPFDQKNVPKHYLHNQDDSWLKIKQIEKINTPLPKVTDFKNIKEKQVKAKYVRKPIYVLDMPLKTSILAKSDCPDIRDNVKPPSILEEQFKKEVEIKERQAAKLSLEELKQKMQKAPKRVISRDVVSKQYDRNPYVARYVKIRANGLCQLCGNDAPFIDNNGYPYLEIHHIEWLSKDGKDTVDNTVALCPNCHRKMHILDLKKDKTYLLENASI